VISPAAAKRNRAELLRQLHRDQRRKLLARLAELRAEEARARVERREQLALARQRCVTRAEHATLDAAAAYKLAVQLAKDARAATKAVARDQCILEPDDPERLTDPAAVWLREYNIPNRRMKANETFGWPLAAWRES
jgi:hypothetical protein